MTLKYFDFEDHLESVEWISQLPKGLLNHKVNLTYNVVSLTKLPDGYQIYIGPKLPDKGGDGIMITLDQKCRLKDYVIERLEPLPINNN